MKSDKSPKIFAGPRTAISRLTAATSSLGQILPIEAPYRNCTYSLNFNAPYVRCEDATAEQAVTMDHLLDQEMQTVQGSIQDRLSSYYAFVPVFEDKGNGSFGITPLSKPRMQIPINASNELWITFMRTDSYETVNTTARRHYSICRLWNTTYDINLKFEDGLQTVTRNNDLRADSHNLTPYPSDSRNISSNGVQRAYSAFMWVITDQLVGSMSLSEDIRMNNHFGLINTPIQHNSLLGSNDLDYHFYMNQRMLYPLDNNMTLSFQRLQDKALARNLTLDILVEELSFNVTISLMNNLLLT
jgi:hypothetical protein